MMVLNELSDDLDFVYGKTASLWEDVRNKTIFITGGTGFFGVWLLMSFVFINRKLHLNAKLILLTRDKNKFLNKFTEIRDYSEIEFLEGDITDFNFIDDNIDYIIHAATEASVKLNLEQPLAMFDTVVNGTKRVLEFAKNKNVKSFLLTSSGAVYGSQPSSITNLDENYLGAPLPNDASSVYGEGKRMSEVLCAVYHRHFKLPVKIARCYAFIGPFLPLNTHFAAGNFINNILNNEDIVIEGDGTPQRSYMYASDLAIWLWTILFNGANNKPYNVGSDQALTIKELALKIAGKESDVVIKSPIVGGDAQRYVPNIDRAKNELNLRIYTEINMCLEKTIKFNKKFN